jgi:hypothetical protein
MLIFKHEEEKVNLPNVYYDFKTKNMSFLKTAKELRELGVRNYMFPLMIYDKDLIGVDPHDKDLSPTIKGKILKECMINYWYFCREIIRVPVPGGNVRYELHRGNLAMTFCMLLNINTMVCLPRQHYKTGSAVSVYLWIEMFASQNYTMVFMHKSYTDGVGNLKRLTDMFESERVPKWMVDSILDTKNDTMKMEQLTLSANNNTIKTVSPPSSVEAADKAGRGLTSPIIWLDEVALTLQGLLYSNVYA